MFCSLLLNQLKFLQLRYHYLKWPHFSSPFAQQEDLLESLILCSAGEIFSFSGLANKFLHENPIFWLENPGNPC
jgi:hypothetical protein